MSGESYGSTVFYYNVEEIVDALSQRENEVSYELRFKAQTYSPVCRTCGKTDSLEVDFHARVIDQLVSAFVRRVLKVIKMREGWSEET